jgi:hypothetical protein
VDGDSPPKWAVKGDIAMQQGYLGTGRNLIQRITVISGIVYYGFLALHSLYEFFVGGNHISILVISPLFYAISIFGALHLLLTPFYAFQKLFAGKRVTWDRSLHSLSVGFFGILGAIGMATAYLEPGDLGSLLDTGSWILILITASEILLRTLIFPRLERGKRIGFLEGLKQAEAAYPIGTMSFAGLFMGTVILAILYVPSSRPDSERILVFGSYFFTIFLFLFQRLSHGFGKALRRDHHFQERSAGELARVETPHQTRTALLWSPWISILSAIVSTVLIYYLLQSATLRVPIKQLFILIFAALYAFLAWIRFSDLRNLKGEVSQSQI